MADLRDERTRELFSRVVKNRVKADARSRYLLKELQKLDPGHPALKDSTNLDILSGANEAGEGLVVNLQ